MIKIRYSNKFKKKLDKYNHQQKEKIKQKVWTFVKNPHSPSLKTHKLSGKLKNYWSFSVGKNLRIMFKFFKDGIVDFIDIGTHEIYQ